jgi:aspartate 1-decarboxylase
MEATREFMYGKIHRCTVTGADLNYVGSITIDSALLRAARLLPHTAVDVVNIANGARLTTYIIEGPEGGGDICLNGAAAHHFKAGDLAIIMAWVTKKRRYPRSLDVYPERCMSMKAIASSRSTSM